MSEPNWSEFLAAFARPGQPAAAFVTLQDIARRTVGANIFTVMVRDDAAKVQRRLHSSHPREYPVSGYKPQTPGKWQSQVIDRQEVFVANTIAEIAEVFPDHELIKSLGCESVVNVPVVYDGAVIGCLNLLEVAGFYTPERVEKAMALRPLGLAAILAAKADETKKSGVNR